MEPSRTPPASSNPGALSGGLRLGRVLGIPVAVHWSLLLIFLLVLFNLALGVFPSWHPDWSPVLNWLTATSAAILFFASVLGHELSHSIVAERQGIHVARITLFLFGGVSEMQEEPQSPGSEFLIAVVGPVTSLTIGAAAVLAGTWGVELDPLGGFPAVSETVRGLNPVRTLLVWLGPINLLLGIFNLVPGFPLDGGRVFRSALWWLTGDIIKATRWAAGIGQLFGWILIFLGFMNLFGGSAAQGLWLVLIGWFLINAAGMSYQHMFLGQALKHLKATDLMRDVTVVEPELSVQEFVDDCLMRDDQLSYPVVLDGQLVGIVGLREVQKLERDKWPWTRVGGIMVPREQLVTLDAASTAAQAAQTLTQQGTTELPVVDGSRFRGVIRQQDIVRWIALHPPEDH